MLLAGSLRSILTSKISEKRFLRKGIKYAGVGLSGPDKTSPTGSFPPYPAKYLGPKISVGLPTANS
jgi:hypothetical protein